MRKIKHQHPSFEDESIFLLVNGGVRGVKEIHSSHLSGFPIFSPIFPYLFRIFPFYVCVDILSLFSV